MSSPPVVHSHLVKKRVPKPNQTLLVSKENLVVQYEQHVSGIEPLQFILRELHGLSEYSRLFRGELIDKVANRRTGINLVNVTINT